MVSNGNKNEDLALDALFAAARRQRPEPAPDFLARLAAEAEREMPRPDPAPASLPVKGGFFAQLAGLFAVSGLTGAAALGVWIGFVMPDVLNDITGTGDGYYLSEFLPSADLTALGD